MKRGRETGKEGDSRSTDFRLKSREGRNRGDGGDGGIVLATVHQFLCLPVRVCIKGCMHFAFLLGSE